MLYGRGVPFFVYDMSLMHEIDGSEGEGSPPRVKRTRRVFPRPTYNASSACALRCSGAANSCEYVRGRAIAVVDYFSREVCSKTNLYILASLHGSSIRFCPSDSAVRKPSSFSVSDTLS